MGFLSIPGFAQAQTALPQFQIDQNFVSTTNQTTGDPVGWVHDPRYIGMVKVNVASGIVDSNPVTAANKVMDQIRDRFGTTLHAGNIPVVIAGFAHCTQPDGTINPHIATCLHHPTDAVVAAPGGILEWPFDPDNTANQQLVYKYAHIHPWMNGSRARLSAWMDDFLDQVFTRHENPDEPIPLPTRFAFDSEDQLTGCCAVAWSYQMKNFRKDARWHSDVVPGHGQTMENLFQSAVADHGWDFSAPGGACREGFDQTFLPSHMRNRPFAHWLYEVLRRAKAGMMEECAYGPIRARYQLAGAQIPATSNYAEFLADGKPDTFGWFQDKNVRFIGGCQSDELNTFNISTRAWVRGYVDPYNEGARYGHTFLTPDNVPRARWATIGTVTWASHDAPQLYAWTHTPNPYYTHRQANLYLPGQPPETREQAALRLNRHRLEAIQYSGEWTRPPNPSPYVLFPFECGSFDLYPTERYTTLMLAMLRGQAVAEILPFTRQGPTLALWEALRRCDRRAHAFHISAYDWWFSSAGGETLLFGEDLYYSRRDGGAAETWLQSVVSGPTSIGAFFVQFDPLLSSPAEPLRLHLECRLTDQNGNAPSSLTAARGDVYFWDWTAPGGGSWAALQINDDGNGTSHYRFHTGDITMRRGFDVSGADVARFVNAAGVVKVLLRWEASVADITDVSGGHFLAWIDHVQLMRIPGTEPDVVCVPGPAGGQQGGDPCEECFTAWGLTAGPDVNFDGFVDETDAQAMIDGFTAGSASADYDGNSVVEIDDLALFASDFVSVQ